MAANFYQMLGLAQRAGKVASGEAAAEAVIKKNKGKFVIIAENASNRTKKYFTGLSKGHKVPYIIKGSKNELGNSLGKSPRSVIVILEDDFAGVFLKLTQG